MTPPPAMTTSAVTATPFAGITRIRYDGRRRAASLSAPAGSRVRKLFPTVHLISAARVTLYQPPGPAGRLGGGQGSGWWLDGPMTSDLRARLADARLYLCTDSRRSQ